MKSWLTRFYDRFISTVTDYPCRKKGHVFEMTGSYKINSYAEKAFFHCVHCPEVIEKVMKI